MSVSRLGTWMERLRTSVMPSRWAGHFTTATPYNVYTIDWACAQLLLQCLSPSATCAFGTCHSATSADSPVAHMVVSPSATCAGGAFSSSHWRKHCAGTWATCTVWCATVHAHEATCHDLRSFVQSSLQLVYVADLLSSCT